MKSVLMRQLFDLETSTYTYIIADRNTKEGVIIDPVLENIDRDVLLLKELGIDLKYILETHVHADHITGAGKLRSQTGAKIGISSFSGASGNDIALMDGDKLTVGEVEIVALSTPGHTNGCMCFSIENMVFTGDTLLFRKTGRTDFQQGSSSKMYQSIRKKLFTLPDETYVYPSHDYSGHLKSTIGEEKKFNTRVKEDITEKQFLEIMQNLNLPKPKKIEIAVPANMLCGDLDSKEK